MSLFVLKIGQLEKVDKVGCSYLLFSEDLW